jgi:hypothetical protein
VPVTLDKFLCIVVLAINLSGLNGWAGIVSGTSMPAIFFR